MNNNIEKKKYMKNLNFISHQASSTTRAKPFATCYFSTPPPPSTAANNAKLPPLAMPSTLRR
jgi:hypothetical protein